jgi:hypothetical protein
MQVLSDRYRIGQCPSSRIDHRRAFQDQMEIDVDCDQLLRSADEAPPTSSHSCLLPASSSIQPAGTTPAVALVTSEDCAKPVDKVYVDQVVNILIRMAAQAPDTVGDSTI